MIKYEPGNEEKTICDGFGQRMISQVLHGHADEVVGQLVGQKLMLAEPTNISKFIAGVKNLE